MELRAGYKITEVGIIPEDWEVKAVSEFHPFITSGSRGWAKYYSENGSLFLRITNMVRDSIYPDLNDLRYVQLPKNENEGKRTQLKNGDVLISITADIGIISYINESILKPAFINQHIALVRFENEEINSCFISYFLISASAQKHFISLTDNGAKAGMSLGRVNKIIIAYPERVEQNAIVSALSDMDNLISTLEKLIAKKRNIKQGVMKKILQPKKGWVVKMLGDFLDYEQPTEYLVTDTEYDDNNQTPVLTAGKTFILGYTNEEHGIFKNLPVIIFDDFTTAIKFVDFPFKAKSSAMKMLIPKNDRVNLRFIYEIMSQIKYPLGDHKRHWIGEYRHLEITVPSTPEEQTHIATILSDMDAEIMALETKLDKYKKLKMGMLQNLLTGKVRLR